MNKLSILLNDELQFEYDRETPPDQGQMDFLNKMDKGMDASGVILDKEKIKVPTEEQKTQFVATNLFNAIEAKNGGMIGSMTTYLALRNPKLKQVNFVKKEGEEVTNKMIYDKA